MNDGTDDSATAYTMTIDIRNIACGTPSFGDRREIWTGTVTVGVYTGLFGNSIYGYSAGASTGALDVDEFTIGSMDYEIATLTAGGGFLIFGLPAGGDRWRDEAIVNVLRLHVCDANYDFSASHWTLDFSVDPAGEIVPAHDWTTSLDWSPPVTTRTLYLSLPANNAATGEPAITGTAQAGQELTVDASPIMDTDGLTGVDFTYKWFRVDPDGISNETEISGETAATYTLTAADAGKKIKVKVSFTDNLSGEETRTSTAYPSSGTVTTTTQPALLSVTVTSTPRKTTDTYGAREHIEFSMTFDAPVTVTGDPTFAFDLGGASTATWYAGSGTATLRFSHAVTGGSSGDRDTNGISWAANAIALNGGTIAGIGNAVAAILTHAAQSNLAAHKVDGRTTPVTPATVTVAVTSTPTSLADTYGFGETIVITVTASAAVEVVGDPGFRFTIGADPVRAAYDRVNSTATRLLFAYTVQAGDAASNGISIGDGSTTFDLDSDDRIRTAAHRIDIDRSHTAPGTLSGHKVDGSRIADNTAPELVAAPDGAKVFTDELTLTYDEALDEGSVPEKGEFKVSLDGGTAQAVSAVAVDGTTVTLTLATPAVFEQVVTLTYTVPATNPLRDLFGNPAGALTNHPVTNETIVLAVVSIAAVHAKAAPLLADAVFRLTASPAPASDLAVTLSIAQAGAYLASTEQTVTIPAGQTSATGTFPIADDYTLASGGLTATVTGVGRLYVPAAANAATVQVVVVDPPIVAQWAEDAYEVAEGKDATAALTLKTAAGMPKPRADYKVRMFTTNDSAVDADDFTAVSAEVTVQPGDWTADGAVFAASVPATVETVGDSLLEGEERFRLQVSAVTGQAPLGLECPAGLRDLGGAGRCATVITIGDDETVSVTAVTPTSTPGADETYLGGETIEFTVTFTAPVTVTGTPTFAFMLGEETREAAYARGSETADLVFAYTVQAGEIDTDGISWKANALALDGGTVRLTTTDPNVEEDAALGHVKGDAQREHRVDAVPPGVESASMQGTVLELVYDEALDEGSVPEKGEFKVSLDGGTAQAVSAVAVDGTTVTLTLATPAVFEQVVTLTYTVPATNPLRDLFGNPAGALTNHPVTNETIVLAVVSIAAVHAKAAPLLADAVFRLTASPAPASDLAVTLSIAQAGAYLASTEQTVTIPAGQTSATGTFPIADDYTLASDGLAATVTGGGRLYVPAAANAATVQVVVVDPPIVAQWAEDAYEVAEGKDATAALTLKTAAGMPKPRADYKVRMFTTNDSAVDADDFTAVSAELTGRPGDWTADGAVFAASVPATVETVGDSLLEGEERFRLQVSAVTGQAPLGLECPAGLRDLGGAGRCATVITIDDDETVSVTAVTPTSMPAADETYLGGETIEFTVTFTAPVTVTGTPTFAFMLGEETREAAYARGSETADLVFAYTVQAGETDTDGILWSANALALGEGGTIRLTTTDPDVEENASLKHEGADAQGEHRVDADPPGLKAPTTMTGAVLTLLYDEALDPASRPAGGVYTLTAGSVTSHPASVAIAEDTVTLTFGSAPADDVTMLTLAYTAPASNPVKDEAGNPAPGFSGLSVVRGPVVVRIDVAGPTERPADRYRYTKAHLSSNVVGLRRYNAHKMTAHGKGAELEFVVTFDRPVMVTGTGKPTLELDLWGETKEATLLSGSGTSLSPTLTFTWRVAKGDNDFDGIKVKDKGLHLPTGTKIVDSDVTEDAREFVESSYGGKWLEDDKIFGGFHEMWIELKEGYAVEGEDYTFSVKRTGENSRDPGEESHYVLMGIADSAFPGTPALGRHEGSDNGPGGRTVTFKPGATEGRRSNTEVLPSVTPPDDEGPTEGRTMTIALHATHVTLENEAGKLVRRIYMPRIVDGVFEVATVPVRPIGTARAGAAPAIVGTPAVSAPQRNGAYAAEERIEAQVAFDTVVHRRRDRRQPDARHRACGPAPRRGLCLGLGLGHGDAALRARGAEGAAAARAIANGLVLNGATVRDADGNDAVLEFGENPRIASLAIGAAPGGDGTWDAGETVEVAVTFEEPVTVDTEAGTPTLRARVGAATYAIPYASGTGTDTLTFSITREDGAAPAPTVIVEGDSLALNRGAIESTAGLVADIAHPGAARAGFAAPELPSIEVSDAEAREGEALEFRLELSQASETPVSVDYETADGTAQEGADYVPVSGTVSFAPGETVKKVSVATLGDGNAEPAETLPLRLSNAEGATLATTEASGTIAASGGADTFTGAFSGVPEEHDGETEFTLTLTFDEEPEGLSYKTVRDSLFTREGGTIGGARRASPPSNKAFVLMVTPTADEAVTLTLKAVPPCGQEKTVCTAGGSVLSGPLGVTVPGPAALSVADAQVQEGPGAVLEFVVSLDRRRHAPVRVDYATLNGEAVAGDDYVHTAGTLTFSPGETRHTVSVPVLADEHDEESETLTLKLLNPVGARIADGEAVGTIRNNGAIPKAWIARFGRTVAEQVLVAVEGRMRASPAPGAEITLAGERIGAHAEPGSEAERDARREEEARRDAERLADWLRGETDPEEAQRRSRAVTPRDLQTGSSFALTSETAGKDLVSLWGRGAVSRFDGREGRLTLDGEVVTGMLGADWTRGRWTAGLIVSHSAAEGGYSGAPGAGDGPGDGAGSAAGSGPGSGSGTGGRVEATLTGVFPWARHALSERLEAWGAAGYGQGELTVTPKKPGTDEDGAAIRTDLDLRMAAAGLRGVLLDPESGSGFQLTGKTDAMVVQTASGRRRSADGGNLAPARATVSRLRLGLEGSRTIRLGGGAALTPSLEIGVRHDGGDAETGFGLDLGGGLALSDPKRGLQAELRGRGLLAHESKGFRDLGFSGSLAWEGKSGSDRGAKLRLTQTVGGSSSGGADALLSRTTLEGLAANDNGEGGNDELKSRRLELKFGYGLSAFGDRFTWTPEAGVGLSDTGRDYSLGWRLVLGGSGSDGGSLELSFEARRRESANDDTDPVHEVGLRLTARF